MTFIKEFAPSLASVSTSAADGIYDVTFITEGEGSTGYYSRELLETYGPKTFREGRNSFFNHVKWHEEPSDRDILTAAGKILESRYVVEDGVGQIKGKIQIVPQHREFVEFFKENIGLSIYANGTQEYDENTGRLNITSFDPEFPYTSVDLVVAAGRGGKFDSKIEDYKATENADPKKVTALVESFRKVQSLSESRTPVAPAVESKDKKGDILTKEELAEALEPMLKMLEGLVAEKQAEVDAEANADAVKSAVTEALAQYESRVKAIEEADLLDPQIEELKERAKTEDVADAIAKAKLVAEAARKAVSEADAVRESGQYKVATGGNFTVGGW